MQQDSLSVNKVKDNIISHIIQDLVSRDSLNPNQADFKRYELENKIKSKQLITNTTYQSGLTNSKAVSDTLESMYIDLLTTFGCVNELDDTIARHIELNESTINSLKVQISKANDKLDSFEAILSSKSNPDNYVEGFRNADGIESQAKFYTERYGEAIPPSCRANYNSNEELITLPYLVNSNMMLYNNGVSLGTVNISKQSGNGLLKIVNDKNSLENIIDTSSQSYWGETILCDSPMKIVYSNVRPIDPIDMKDFCYGLNHGALCELELTFEAVSTINEVTLAPYGQYPIDIIAIRYKTSDDVEEPIQEVVFPDNPINDRVGKTILSPGSFRFPDINCKKLYILFSQIHYTKSTFVYNSDDVFKNELWFSVTNSRSTKPLIDSEMLFKPLYTDRGLSDTAWSYINNLSVKNKHLDLKKILFDNKNINRVATKYQYTYGFYNISPNFNDFERTGVYVSNPITANGNIQSLRIITDEKHPLTDDKKHITDIEYYISYSEDPTYNDWKAILPRNIDYIESELLQLEYSLCMLRFPAKEVSAVYINGTLMDINVDYMLHRIKDNKKNPELNGAIYAIDIPNIDFFANYTVSYVPLDCSKELILIDKLGEVPTINSIENINATNTSYYQLKNYPYINPKVKSITSVRLTDKNTGAILAESSNGVLCVTNPYSPEESYKNFDKSCTKFQYYTYKNYIYFNNNIPSNYQIEISYSHYISSIRLKAILRRNTIKNGWVTPVLDKIKYEFVTID